MLTKQQRQRGIVNYGSAERLRAALSRAVHNKQLTVAIIGGSIAAGQGAEDAPGWADRLETYLKETYGRAAHINITVNNGAVPGTTSQYMSGCINLHVPATADIVVVDYTVNDEVLVDINMNNPQRRPLERLLRKLLAMPNNPAVLLLHSYAWFRADMGVGLFFNNAERDFSELALYYGLPSVSVKACCHEAMRDAVPGFQVHTPRDTDPLNLRGLAFYRDEVHPDGVTGHRVLAELAITLLQRAVVDLLHNPLTDEDKAYINRPLPAPMLPTNYESLADKCFVGEAFKAKAVVGKPVDWEWVNESHTLRPKWGYVATRPASVLQLNLNTTASTGNPKHPVLVQIAYLASYEHMGKALVLCTAGCECDETLINGHHREHNSQLLLHRVYVSQAEECAMSVTVTDDSDSPGKEHKVKLAAVIVSEEAGELDGIVNAGAVEHVHDISFRREYGSGEVFDIRNHI
eukprot:gene12114-12253_t